MKLLLTLVLLFSTSLLPATRRENVEGTWKVTGDVMGTPVTPVCAMKQDDKNILTGTCKVQTTDTPLKGEVKDKEVTWQFNVDYNGNNLTVIFNGKLDSESKMKGTINVQPGDYSGDFTAEKDTTK